jgi:hypothetical protein
MQEKIKPIYQELMGILSQTPVFDNPHSTLSTVEIWENYNDIIERLNTISERDYNHFKIKEKIEQWGDGSSHPYVNGTLFRQKLNGLINHLHGEHFPNERTPFSGEPQHVFEQNQVVSQSTDVQVIVMTVLEVQEKLIKNEDKYSSDSPEGKFIKIVKESLKNVKSTMELINLILQTAANVGLTPDKLSTIFS